VFIVAISALQIILHVVFDDDNDDDDDYVKKEVKR